MGLLDKLKAAKNAITGGAAKVYIEVGEAVRGQPVPVKVRAVGQADAKVNAVYVLVRAYEEARVDDVDVSRDGRIYRESVFGRHETYEVRVDLSGAGELKNGEELTFEGELTFPAAVPPSMQGQLFRHTWEVQAGLDMPGNDPDSGWIEVAVA